MISRKHADRHEHFFLFFLLFFSIVALTHSSFVYLLRVTVVFPVFFFLNYQQYDSLSLSRFPLKCVFSSLSPLFSLSPLLFAIINCIAGFFSLSLSEKSLFLFMLFFFLPFRFGKIFPVLSMSL